MNIAYVRKTEKTVAEVVEQFRAGLTAEGIMVVGEKDISGKNGIFVYFMKPSWTEKIIEADHMLVGLVPSVTFIWEQEGRTMIGVSNPQILAGGAHIDTLAPTIEEMDRVLRKIMNEAAGVGDPKLEKITLYSTATCPYCRMEKEYLEKHNIAFDLVMVDKDRKAAEAMVQRSGQTGVPQTEVLFDDGDTEIIMGFDKGRLNELLKLTA